jgi:hypothetical protein
MSVTPIRPGLKWDEKSDIPQFLTEEQDRYLRQKYFREFRRFLSESKCIFNDCSIELVDVR